MIGFISSVLASLLASGIIAISALLFRKKLGSLAKRWLIHIFDMGTYDIFSNDFDEEYRKDLKEELYKAKFIHVFAGRGRFLFNEPYRTLLKRDNIEIQILLPNLTGKYDVNWIGTALGELSHESSFRSQVSASIEYLSLLKNVNSNLCIKYYHALAVGKITITDTVAYFQPYTGDFSDKSPIYKYKVGSFMYKWAIRYFDSYWNPKYAEADEISKDAIHTESINHN